MGRTPYEARPGCWRSILEGDDALRWLHLGGCLLRTLQERPPPEPAVALLEGNENCSVERLERVPESAHQPALCKNDCTCLAIGRLVTVALA